MQTVVTVKLMRPTPIQIYPFIRYTLSFIQHTDFHYLSKKTSHILRELDDMYRQFS